MNQKLFIKLLTLNLFTSVNCTVVQLCLSISLSYIFSNSIFIFSLFTGLYLMSMGIGVLLIERFNFSKQQWIKIALLNSCFGVLLANPGIVAILLFNEYIYFILRAHQVDLLFLMFPVGIVFTVMIGVVSGAELPILSKFIEKEKWHLSKPIIGVLTSDYFGAFVGTIVFAFVLYPFTGLISTIFAVQIITLVCINFMYFSMSEFQKKIVPCLSLVVLNLYVIFLYVNKDSFVKMIDAISAL